MTVNPKIIKRCWVAAGLLAPATKEIEPPTTYSLYPDLPLKLPPKFVYSFLLYMTSCDRKSKDYEEMLGRSWLTSTRNRRNCELEPPIADEVNEGFIF